MKKQNEGHKLLSEELNSIYDDLLCGIGMNYNFQDSEFVQDEEERNIP